MKRGFLYLISLVMFIGLVSANGITINQTTYNINKTQGTDENIILTIQNTEPYSFFNVSFEDNNFISMDKIPELISGQSKSFTAKVTTNENTNKEVKIKGLFFSNIGQSNVFHNVTIFAHDVNKCSFTVREGDTVKWLNTINDEIVIKKASNGEPIATISANSSYEKFFGSAQSFEYYLTRQGFKFPTTNCVVTVLSAAGYVNDPSLDARFNLSVAITFNPTTISYNLLVTNYTLSFFDTQDGVLSITNTGSQVAKNVNLTAKWFSFSANNFDLSPGQTKGLTYVLDPQVSATNQTNMTHKIPLTISGNFNTITTNFSVYINYANIEENGNVSLADAKSLLEAICSKFPEADICQEKTKIIVQGNGEASAQLNITEEQWRQFWLTQFEEKENRQTLDNYVKENIALMREDLNRTAIKSEQAATEILAVKETQESSWTSVFMGIIVFVLILLIAAVIGIAYVIKTRNKTEDAETWQHQ